MKIVSAATMRELDRATIEDRGVPGEVLMDRAGLGVARVVRDILALSRRDTGEVLLVVGRGNNGGDGFVAARHLSGWGLRVRVMVAAELSQISGDAWEHYLKMVAAGVEAAELADDAQWDAVGNDCTGDIALVLDGLLGTGTRGAPRDQVAAAVRCINRVGRCCPVVAIDMPSGLNSDTGAAEGDCVNADVTVTMGLPKQGLFRQAGPAHAGSVQVVDIGIPGDLVTAVEDADGFIAIQDVRELISVRERVSHKGTYGHVLVVGGSRGASGAVALALQGALHVGAGLVSAVVPQAVSGVVAGHGPEAMVHGAEETDAGSLSSTWLDGWVRKIPQFDAILIGPGMTTHNESRRIVRRLLSMAKCPVILDADALNVCAGQARSLIRKRSCPVIITPHPGEMARLLDCSVEEVQADRQGRVREAVKQTEAVVVLKGAGTVVAAPDEALQLNGSGNPGMATGGTGDVLGGMIAGLVAQGLKPFDAARAGVAVHGRAGDRAAWQQSQAGMAAGDLVAAVPHVLREIMGR